MLLASSFPQLKSVSSLPLFTTVRSTIRWWVFRLSGGQRAEVGVWRRSGLESFMEKKDIAFVDDGENDWW